MSTNETEHMLHVIESIKKDFGLEAFSDAQCKVTRLGPIVADRPWISIIASNPEVISTPTVPGTLRLVPNK